MCIRDSIVAVDNTDGTLTTGVQATVKFETQATGATEMEETKTAGKTETIGALYLIHIWCHSAYDWKVQPRGRDTAF